MLDAILFIRIMEDGVGNTLFLLHLEMLGAIHHHIVNTSRVCPARGWLAIDYFAYALIHSSLFWKSKRIFMKLPCGLCVYPPNNFRMPETICMNLGMYIMAREPISMSKFIGRTN
jgi:hypothetical protein